MRFDHRPSPREHEARNHQTNHRADGAEHERLGKELHDEAPTAGAECRANQELPLSTDGASEQQHCNVAAQERGQQHEERVDRRQHQRRRGRQITDSVGQGEYLQAHILARLRKHRRCPGADHRRLGDRLLA